MGKLNPEHNSELDGIIDFNNDLNIEEVLDFAKEYMQSPEFEKEWDKYNKKVNGERDDFIGKG